MLHTVCVHIIDFTLYYPRLAIQAGLVPVLFAGIFSFSLFSSSLLFLSLPPLFFFSLYLLSSFSPSFCRQDPSLVVPDFDPSSEERKLWLSSIPFLILLVSLVAMCLAIRLGRNMDREEEKR